MRRLKSALILGAFVLVMLSPLTAMAASSRQDSIVLFSISCLDDTGGGLLHPGASTIGATMSYSFAIANVFETMGVWEGADLLLPDRVLKDNMTAWIEQLQVTDSDALDYGGILAYSSASNATLMSSFYAVLALTALAQTDALDDTSLLNFIINLQLTNATEHPETVGGFTDRAFNSSATVAATYYALEILNTYDQLTLINQSLAISWLNSSQLLGSPSSTSYGGFANGRNSTTADLQSTFMAIRSLELLNALSVINQTATISYILPHYRSDLNYPQFIGGFSTTPDDPVATHWATYYAVATLLLLGAEAQLTPDAIITWVLSTQNTDGGFADTPGSSGFSPQTNLAISTLALLDALARLQEPFGNEPYVFPWWILAIAIIIIVVVLFIYIARRAEWF
ncbi:MAG: prenyltransferase/squalene oxidase repeat-containing protein [Candidatus Hodarchaeota archaeon]